ncbi:MAG: 50S ribosomal protein L37ae [Candidatus Bathyarchaeota archaeon]|nr:MAG: 50S ribosomal protein L37ae [Candidatus Bathyarchaeota archaeon]
MTRTKKVGSSGRLGSRYGVRTRRRLSQVESQSRAVYECPRCGRRRVKRISIGIWGCSKCGYTFAGGAHVPLTKLGEIVKRATRGTPE